MGSDSSAPPATSSQVAGRTRPVGALTLRSRERSGWGSCGRCSKHFVLFVVYDPAACRDFYVEHFGFQVEVDVGWYVVLTSGSERPMGLGFLQADHPTQLAQHRSPTAGSRFITFEVDEVDPIAERLLAAGRRCRRPVT